MNQQVRLGDFLGTELEENFLDFDLTDIQSVLNNLKETDAFDLPHAEMLQQQSLRGADILIEYIGKLTKTVGYLENKLNKAKNKVSLEYKAPDGSKTTTDMKLWASGASPEVEEIGMSLAKAKASKIVLDKKYDLLIKSHYHFKEIADGLKKTILGYTPVKVPDGW